MPRPERHLAVVAAIVVASAATAFAFAPHTVSSSLSRLERVLPFLVPAQDPDAQARLKRSHPGVAGLEREAGGPWHVDFDISTGRLRQAWGTGIPLIPGLANSLKGPAVGPAEVEGVARSFLERHASLFNMNLAELTVSQEGSQPIDEGRVQPILFRRSVGGVDVEYAQVQLVLNRGNLTYINVTGQEPVTVPTVPTLSEAETWANVRQEAALVDASVASAVPAGRSTLKLVPVQDAAGQPVRYRLARYHFFTLPDGIETWNAVVDAHDGELLEFVDENRYACSLENAVLQGQVRGGVRPAKATEAEVMRNFASVSVTDDSVRKTTDSGGYYPYSGKTASSTLQGKFFAINCNGCTPNPPFTSNKTDGVLDFGTGGVNQTSNGRSTPADRTCFYHLTVAHDIAKKWISRPWLDSTVGANVNINQTCNAFWNGSTVNFFRSGGGCQNTGEIRDVMQHEWGHGMDSNDGVTPVDSAMGEAYGDHIALFVDHDSCIGQSFATGNSGPYCVSIPDCLQTATCDGVRNIDEKRASRGLMTMTTAMTKCGTGSCSGPLGRQCHCEGEIYGQCAFHMAMNLLTGQAYDTGVNLPLGNPMFSSVAAWFIHERIFFNAAQIMASYAPSHRQTRGTGAYMAYVTVDDDNGNLNDGTPNAAYINQAFEHHEMAERTVVPDALNCTPPGDPTITVTAAFGQSTGFPQVHISWPDQNASFYVVYRTLKLSDVWLPIRSQVPDDGRPVYDVYDEPVQIGETYYYAVVAVNANGCPSAGNGVKSVTVALPDPSAVVGQLRDPAPGGDGDGIPEPGELIKIRIDLKELANLVGITNASIELSTKDSLATVTVPGPIAYGNVAPGATVQGPVEFEVGISSAHGCGTDVPLIAAVSADNACALRGVSFSIPTAGCVPAPRGEGAPKSFSLGSDALGSCTDRDGLPDNGETFALDVLVENKGSASASNVRVTLNSLNPKLAITSTNPMVIPSLPPAGTSNVGFELRATGATCMELAEVEAVVDSDSNLFPIKARYMLTLEEDRVATSVSAGFETDFGQWTNTGFTRSTVRRATGTYSAFAGPRPEGHVCDNSGDGGNDCSKLVSPVLIPGPGGRLEVSNWYSFEAFSGGQYWDRANLHIIEPDNTHVVITPVSGKPYVGATTGSAFCHLGDENGWAGDTAAGKTWGMSRFDLSPWAGREIRIEINYNSDALAICEGLYLDDVVSQDLWTRSCDQLTCSAAPSVVVESCGAADRCAATGSSDGVIDPNDTVTYTVTLRNTGTGDASNVQGNVVVSGGGTLVSGGTIGGTPRVDIPAGGTYQHQVVVTATGSCGQTLDIDVTNLRDASNVFGSNLTICDKGIGASQPGGPQLLRDVVGLVIPENIPPALARTLNYPTAAPVTAATLRIQVSHARPADLRAWLMGPKGTRVVANAAINGSLDVMSLINGDGAGDYTLFMDDYVKPELGTLVEWSLDLVKGPWSQCNPCVAGGCTAPVLSVSANALQVCPGGSLRFQASFTSQGSGGFDYEWDFGDGNVLPVLDPLVPVFHRFDGLQPGYTVVLRARSLSSGTCDAQGSVVVSRDPNAAPGGGRLGNRLMVAKQGKGAQLDWAGSAINPPRFVVHKTFSASELVDTPSGIGDEPVLARTSASQALDGGALGAMPALAFYEVYAATTCGDTVVP